MIVLSNDYEDFKSKSIAILNLSFFTYLAFILVGFVFYFAILPNDVQNSLPIILALLLGFFTWVIRSKIDKSSIEQYTEIRQALIQWFVISVILIFLSTIVVLLYPQG